MSETPNDKPAIKGIVDAMSKVLYDHRNSETSSTKQKMDSLLRQLLSLGQSPIPIGEWLPLPVTDDHKSKQLIYSGYLSSDVFELYNFQNSYCTHYFVIPSPPKPAQPETKPTYDDLLAERDRLRKCLEQIQDGDHQGVSINKGSCVMNLIDEALKPTAKKD